MIDLIRDSFRVSLNKIINEIDFSDNYQQLNEIDNDFYRLVFINELINKVSSESSIDILQDYLDFMKKANKHWNDKFNQVMQDL